MSEIPTRTPLTPDQFRAKWQIGKAKYHELVNTGQLRQIYITPRNPRVLPEDEDAFIQSCRKDNAA
jgi:hypothetical protein